MTEPRPDLREALAAIEHDQWIEWSRTVAEQGLTPERLERWQRFWVPYDQLDEPTKDHDRVWADKVLAALATTPPAEHTLADCRRAIEDHIGQTLPATPPAPDVEADFQRFLHPKATPPAPEPWRACGCGHAFHETVCRMYDCDCEQYAWPTTPPAQPLPTVEQIERALQELWRVRDSQDHFVYDIPVPPDRQTAAALHGVLSRTLGGPR